MLWLCDLWGVFLLKKKHRSNRRCAFGCAQKAPLVLEFGGNNQKQVIWDSRLGSFFYFFFVSTSHPTDPMGTNGIWDEFTYMFMVDFGWFSWLCKYTGPFGSVPMDLIFWVRFDEHFPSVSAPNSAPTDNFKIFSFIPLEVGFFRMFRFFCGSKNWIMITTSWPTKNGGSS